MIWLLFSFQSFARSSSFMTDLPFSWLKGICNLRGCHFEILAPYYPLKEQGSA
jgi:hypothetical protein